MSTVNTLTTEINSLPIIQRGGGYHYQLDTEFETDDYWIDGSKIYEVYYNCEVLAITTSWKSTGIDVSHIKGIIDSRCIGITASSSTYYGHYFVPRTVYYVILPSTKILYVNSISGNQNLSEHIIYLKYIKN